ncbi:hypothetical protein AAV35_003110 [Salimicrobium jeotgali]|uniref:Uncharacterized protein n=1 Tax=Salimicrobium jeotgali TaxID=1230341 RepID=K2GR91_9BACI|nr:hypothetical protein [Salimicrobium jeotgali]AKG03871.1 hypothetical protein AAV35_003110 [Salimicrobium jeotgali]EKE32899.1 hypothetical protein MJ3_00325 [Salimicrobium jeotgali]MBM7695107.1 hypothetical protein [Salimicrobium jeotgali]
MQSKRDLISLTNLWFDGTHTEFTHAFIERFAYEWVIEIVNPQPIPLIEDKDYLMTLSFEQEDGLTFSSINIEAYDIMQGEEFTVYRFYMYPL